MTRIPGVLAAAPYKMIDMTIARGHVCSTFTIVLDTTKDVEDVPVPAGTRVLGVYDEENHHFILLMCPGVKKHEKDGRGNNTGFFGYEKSTDGSATLVIRKIGITNDMLVENIDDMIPSNIFQIRPNGKIKKQSPTFYFLKVVDSAAPPVI